MKNLYTSMLIACICTPAVMLAQANVTTPNVNAPGTPTEVQPQNDEPVSTLKGQLVRVGDANKYKYSYKKMNVSTNPFGWLVGSYGVAASYALNANVAVTLDFKLRQDYLSVDGTDGFNVQLSAPLYFRKAFDDFYIEPGFSFIKLDVGEEDLNLYGPSVLVGKHWMFDSGLNISAAIGIGRNFSGNSDDEDSDELGDFFEFYPAGYFRVGYAFDI